MGTIKSAYIRGESGEPLNGGDEIAYLAWKCGMYEGFLSNDRDESVY